MGLSSFPQPNPPPKVRPNYYGLPLTIRGGPPRWSPGRDEKYGLGPGAVQAARRTSTRTHREYTPLLYIRPYSWIVRDRSIGDLEGF